VTVIGITWQRVFSEPGETTGAIRMSALDAFRGSGRTIKKPLNMPRSANTVIRYWREEKNADVTVSSAIAVFWVTILMSMARISLDLTYAPPVVLVVSP
jgi:hypothetical protein